MPVSRERDRELRARAGAHRARAARQREPRARVGAEDACGPNWHGWAKLAASVCSPQVQLPVAQHGSAVRIRARDVKHANGRIEAERRLDEPSGSRIGGAVGRTL